MIQIFFLHAFKKIPALIADEPLNRDQATLTFCMYAGIPQPMYRWLKNGVPLGEFSTELFYKIHNTQRQDAGAYQCVAKNDVGAIYSEKNNIIVACK